MYKHLQERGKSTWLYSRYWGGIPTGRYQIKGGVGSETFRSMSFENVLVFYLGCFQPTNLSNVSQHSTPSSSIGDEGLGSVNEKSA